MANAITVTDNGDGTFTLADGTGASWGLSLAQNENPGVQVNITYPDGGDRIVATPIRFKMTQNGKVAADMPSVSADVCAVDADGHIADG